MSIMWKYLDKRSATIAAIKDYSSMQFIISHTAEEIKAERDRMSSTGSPRWDGMPHAHNPQAGEERSLRPIGVRILVRASGLAAGQTTPQHTQRVCYRLSFRHCLPQRGEGGLKIRVLADHSQELLPHIGHTGGENPFSDKNSQEQHQAGGKGDIGKSFHSAVPLRSGSR